MAIDFAQSNNMPGHLAEKLSPYYDKLREVLSLDELMDIPVIQDVVINLDELAQTHGVIGYHYTRSIRSSIMQYGLTIETGEERRRRFLEEYGNLFSLEHQDKIVTAWINYFDESQDKDRDSKLWFKLTKSATFDGAYYLLKYYGGEVVNMPLINIYEDDVSHILSSIGEPMIIKCSLNATDLRTFTSYPWGKVWLSNYHRSFNPSARQIDPDIYTTNPIDRSQIIEIEVLTDFQL